MMGDLNERMDRGCQNSMMMNKLKQDKVREISSKVPDFERLRQEQQDKHQGTWEKYLYKQRDLMKREKQNEKEQRQRARAQ